MGYFTQEQFGTLQPWQQDLLLSGPVKRQGDGYFTAPNTDLQSYINANRMKEIGGTTANYLNTTFANDPFLKAILQQKDGKYYMPYEQLYAARKFDPTAYTSSISSALAKSLGQEGVGMDYWAKANQPLLDKLNAEYRKIFPTTTNTTPWSYKDGVLDLGRLEFSSPGDPSLKKRILDIKGVDTKFNDVLSKLGTSANFNATLDAALKSGNFAKLGDSVLSNPFYGGAAAKYNEMADYGKKMSILNKVFGSTDQIPTSSGGLSSYLQSLTDSGVASRGFGGLVVQALNGLPESASMGDIENAVKNMKIATPGSSTPTPVATPIPQSAYSPVQATQPTALRLANRAGSVALNPGALGTLNSGTFNLPSSRRGLRP